VKKVFGHNFNAIKRELFRFIEAIDFSCNYCFHHEGGKASASSLCFFCPDAKVGDSVATATHPLLKRNVF
jgi:hypothetical protein